MVVKILEALVGRWQGPLAVAFARIGLGIVIPGAIVAYGIACVAGRRAHIIDRAGRLAEVSGLPAVAVGIAYAAVGLLVYVHVCWEEHAYLAGARDLVRSILLGVVAVCLAATLGLALI